MARILFRTVFLLLVIAFAVTSCAAVRRNLEEDRSPIYDVRDIRVFANAPSAMGLIAGVDRRVADAIAVTMRSQLAPRVVLMVRIDRAIFGVGETRNRNEADVSVDVVSIDTGTVIASGAFRSIGYGVSPAMSQEALADIIAARIRYVFSLSAPPVTRYSMPRYPYAHAPPPQDDYIESPAPVENPRPHVSAPKPAASTADEDYIAPSMQAKIEAAEAKPDAGTEMPKPVPLPKPTSVAETPAPVKASEKPVSARSDVEGGAQGKITLKPPVSATTTCTEGGVTPCPPVQQ